MAMDRLLAVNKDMERASRDPSKVVNVKEETFNIMMKKSHKRNKEVSISSLQGDTSSSSEKRAREKFLLLVSSIIQ